MVGATLGVVIVMIVPAVDLSISLLLEAMSALVFALLKVRGYEPGVVPLTLKVRRVPEPVRLSSGPPPASEFGLAASIPEILPDVMEGVARIAVSQVPVVRLVTVNFDGSKVISNFTMVTLLDPELTMREMVDWVPAVREMVAGLSERATTPVGAISLMLMGVGRSCRKKYIPITRAMRVIRLPKIVFLFDFDLFTINLS